MNTADLISKQFANLHGIQNLIALGQGIIGAAFVAWMLIEIVKGATGNKADLVSPLLRLVIGSALIQSVTWIGVAAAEFGDLTSGLMFEEENMDVLSTALSKSTDVFTVDNWYSEIWGMKFLVGLFAKLVYFGMFLIKYLIIDVIHPLLLGVIVIMGIIAVPIGMFPGFQTVGGWLKAVIQVSLWPAIFQLLLVMFASTFKVIFKYFGDKSLGQVVGVAYTPPAVAGGFVEYDFAEFGMLIKFFALCLGFMAIAIGTPILSFMIMGSGPVAALGAFVAATSAKMMGGSRLGKAFGLTGKGGPESASGGGSSSASGSGMNQERIQDLAEQLVSAVMEGQDGGSDNMNTRNHKGTKMST